MYVRHASMRLTFSDGGWFAGTLIALQVVVHVPCWLDGWVMHRCGGFAARGHGLQPTGARELVITHGHGVERNTTKYNRGWVMFAGCETCVAGWGRTACLQS